MEGIWREFGGNLEGIWRGFEGDFRILRGFGGIWRGFGGDLEGITYCHVQSARTWHKSQRGTPETQRSNSKFR